MNKYEEAINWLNAVINKPEVCGGNVEDNNKALDILQEAVAKANILDGIVKTCGDNLGNSCMPCPYNLNSQKAIKENEKLKKALEVYQDIFKVGKRKIETGTLYFIESRSEDTGLIKEDYKLLRELQNE